MLRRFSSSSLPSDLLPVEASLRFLPVYFYDQLSKVRKVHRKWTPESEGQLQVLGVSWKSGLESGDNYHACIFFWSYQCHCVNLLSHHQQGIEYKTPYLTGSQEKSHFPGSSVACVLLCFAFFCTCASFDIQSADFFFKTVPCFSF